MRTAAELESLALRAREGDGEALEGLLRRIHPEVLRRCARFLPCRQDAEEACRTSLRRIAASISGFTTDSLFTTWLYITVSETARQTYRSLKLRSLELPEEESVLRRRDPRTTSVVAGSRIALLEALDQLERERPDLVAPLVLRDLCQLDYSEIADELGLALESVKSRIHVGRTYLRHRIAAA